MQTYFSEGVADELKLNGLIETVQYYVMDVELLNNKNPLKNGASSEEND